MSADRSRYRLVMAAVGGALVAVSVFLPWYGVSLTAHGVALVQQTSSQALAEFGNAQLQSYGGLLQSHLAGLAGHQLASVTAHQALKDISVVLLILAALALLDALIPLSRSASVPAGGGASLALLGLVACTLVLYRIAVPPAPAGEELALSLRGGAWLALAGSAMILAGGVWPAGDSSPDTLDERMRGALSGLSGWTPQG